MRRANKQNGFSLIEIMVSMVLGLVVLAMVLNVFINTKKNHVQNERMSNVLENGRFAMRQLASDLKTIGFMGGMFDAGQVQLDDSLSLASADDCGDTAATDWVFNAANYAEFINKTTATAASTAYKCIVASEIQPDTDVLVVKRAYSVDETDNAAKTDNSVYLRTDYTTGCLWWYSSTGTTAPTGSNCPIAGFKDWRYLTHIYYIRKTNDVGKAIPTLCRKTLTSKAGVPAMDTFCLAEGIEKFHVQFGIDSSSPRDGVPDKYLSALTTDEMKRAVAAKIFVLARADKEDPVFKNDKTYTMGNYSIPPVGDSYYRRVYSTTVLLRNISNTAIFTTGL